VTMKSRNRSAANLWLPDLNSGIWSITKPVNVAPGIVMQLVSNIAPIAIAVHNSF
jgi:hypothetical protein